MHFECERKLNNEACTETNTENVLSTEQDEFGNYPKTGEKIIDIRACFNCVHCKVIR